MAQVVIEHTYHLKGGDEAAVEKVNPLLDRREPIVVYCKDGKTRMKIGDGVHYYKDLDWVGGEDTEIPQDVEEIIGVATFQDLPYNGDITKIYRVINEANLYQWNMDKKQYELLNKFQGEVDVSNVKVISGGNAENLIDKI